MSVKSIPAGRAEARWPAIVALLVALALAKALPTRYQFGPDWFPYVVIGIVIGSMLAVTLAPTSVLWHRVERFIVLALFIVVNGMNMLAVGRLVVDMVTHTHHYDSLTLLESAAVIWTLNVLLFALLYWQLDRAGPEGRAAGATGTGDFRFADLEISETSPAWEPRFLDYLFISFAASTSFAPPDSSRPATHRAKLLLMLQAGISLVTLVLIASRAVGTLS